MEYIEDKQYETKEEMINAILKSTDEFDFLSFYNSGESLSALIVITPQQTIILSPVYRHAYAMDFLYKFLYEVSVADGMDYEEITNNVTIRLVAGESVQAQSFYPESINLYQKEAAAKLVQELTDIKNKINFSNYFDQMIFEETYDDSIRKFNEVKVVDKIDKKIIEDKVIIDKNKKITR